MDDRSWSVDGLLLAPGATLPLALTDSVTYHFAITSATGLTHYVTASLSRRRFVFHRHGARRRRGRGCWIRRRYARRATGWWLQWIDVQAAARPEWRAAERDEALEEHVLEAFRNDPVLSERAIDIGSLNEGVIELAGWVEDETESEHAV